MRIAVPRGRLNGPAWAWLQQAGFALAAPAGRQLWTQGGSVDAVEVRGRDMPSLLTAGVVDAAIVGRDVVDEAGLALVLVRSLDFGVCRLVAAAPRDTRLASGRRWRVATRYPRITRRWMDARGLAGDVVTMSGAVEAAPWLGLADAVVDVVETGATLAANGLVAIETVMRSSATLSASSKSARGVQRWIQDAMAEQEERGMDPRALGVS